MFSRIGMLGLPIRQLALPLYNISDISNFKAHRIPVVLESAGSPVSIGWKLQECACDSFNWDNVLDVNIPPVSLAATNKYYIENKTYKRSQQRATSSVSLPAKTRLREGGCARIRKAISDIVLTRSTYTGTLLLLGTHVCRGVLQDNCRLHNWRFEAESIVVLQ